MPLKPTQNEIYAYEIRYITEPQTTKQQRNNRLFIEMVTRKTSLSIRKVKKPA